MSAHELAAGTVFSNDYRILRLLGEGGMGAVYLAEQLSTGKQRALKVMHARLVTDAKSRTRFLEEARVSGRIESEHVVEIVAAGFDEPTGMPWIAMELLEGGDLAALAAVRGALPPAEVRSIFEQLGDALGAGHRLGIIHRDLKPENIFLAKSRRRGVDFVVKVLDFGIARSIEESRTAATVTTAVGSPMWMAPEQGNAGAHIRPSTDVWAMGLIAFYLLTGKSYWRAAHQAEVSLTALLTEIMVYPLVPASARAAELGVAHRIPPGFDGWFARCVARESLDRFAEAAQASAALDPVLAPTALGSASPSSGGIPATQAMASHASWTATASGPVAAAPASFVHSAPPTMSAERRGTPWLWIGGAIAVLLVFVIAGGVGGFALLRRGAREEPSPPITTTSAPIVAPPIGGQAVIPPQTAPIVAPVIAQPVEPPVIAAPIEPAPIEPAPVAASAPTTLRSLEGRYRIVGSPAGDGCGGGVVLAARHLDVRPSSSSVHADVVDRVYGARVEAGQLIASGRFSSSHACAGTRIEETWTLRPAGDGALVGTLVSRWQLPPSCEPCAIRFRIRAVPATSRRSPARRERAAPRTPPPSNPF